MFRRIACAVLLLATAGCATAPETSFRGRNTEGTTGLLKKWGNTAIDAVIKDEAGRPIIEIKNLPPAQVPIPGVQLLNNTRRPRIYRVSLPPGNYRVDYIPFFYTLRWILVVPVGTYRIDLPRRSTSFSVGYDPAAVYDTWTARHWGWEANLDGGDMPRDPMLQNLNIRFSCC